MSLNLIQFLSRNIHRLEQIIYMSFLTTSLGAQELVIVFETLDVVVGVRVEDVPEDGGVDGGALGPGFPEFVGERVFDEGVPFVAGVPLVVAVAWRLGVGVFCGVHGLGWEKTQVLAPEHTSESSGVEAGGVFLTGHLGLQWGGVFHYNTQF